MTTTRDVKYRAEDTVMKGVVMDIVEDMPEWFDKRHSVAYYVDRCIQKGFCKTADQMRMCALRYIAGKRKVTPPGTKKRKTAAKKLAHVLRNVPPVLLDAVVTVCKSKAADEYRNGNIKAINSMVGMVMKTSKHDAAIIKQLLINKLETTKD